MKIFVSCHYQICGTCVCILVILLYTLSAHAYCVMAVACMVEKLGMPGAVHVVCQCRTRSRETARFRKQLDCDWLVIVHSESVASFFR